MRQIISRTLETTCKKIYIILALAIGIVAAIICNNYIKDAVASGSFYSVVDEVLLLQNCLAFFLFGTAVMIVTIDTSTGLIANEVHEGTFRLLVAKPNTRSQILLAKIIGALIGEILFAVIIVASYFATLTIISNVDGRLIDTIGVYWLPYLLYLIVVIFIFSGISTFLSTIFKKKLAAFLPMMAFIVITIAFFPIQRLINDLSGGSANEFVKFYDTNYHLALIFKQFVEVHGPISSTSTNQLVYAYLMNLFTTIRADSDVVLEEYSTMIVANNALKQVFVLGTYGLVGLLGYLGSFIVIRRKDV